MDTYNINGVAVEYDTFDTVNMELFISELERVQKETEALPKDVAAYRKGMCELVRDVFDTIIGEGTSDKCCGRDGFHQGYRERASCARCCRYPHQSGAETRRGTGTTPRRSRRAGEAAQVRCELTHFERYRIMLKSTGDRCR